MADKPTAWKVETAFKSYLDSVDDMPQVFMSLKRTALPPGPRVIVRAKERRDGIPNTSTPVFEVEIETSTRIDDLGSENTHDTNSGLVDESVLIPDLRTQLNAQGVANLTVYGYQEAPGTPREIEERRFVSRLNLVVIAAGIPNGLT